jgi:hypothetical protein
VSVRDNADRLGRWLMGTGLVGELSVVVAWATAPAAVQATWPLWLYWMFGGIFACS